MRNWHRRLSILFAIFMFFIALSGIGLQVEMEFISPARMHAGPPGGAHESVPVDTLVQNALAGAHRLSGGRIADFAVRTTDDPPTAEVMVMDPQPRRIRLNALTGDPITASDNGLHRFLLEFHRGTLLGKYGYVLSIACGLVLTFFSVSGVWMYVDMYRRRVSVGKKKFVW